MAKQRDNELKSGHDANPRGRITVIAIAFALVVLVLAVYGQSMFYGFVDYDDPEWVRDNPHGLGGSPLRTSAGRGPPIT